MLTARAPLVGSILFVLVTGGTADAAPDAMPAGLYELTTETVMPHLEEALRYATTRETRCLGRADLATAFPILAHDALRGCLLEPRDPGQDRDDYVLVCGGTGGAAGSAEWQHHGGRLRGTLNVRLGGKNMTFSQRVTATPIGPCPR